MGQGEHTYGRTPSIRTVIRAAVLQQAFDRLDEMVRVDTGRGHELRGRAGAGHVADSQLGHPEPVDPGIGKDVQHGVPEPPSNQ